MKSIYLDSSVIIDIAKDILGKKCYQEREFIIDCLEWKDVGIFTGILTKDECISVCGIKNKNIYDTLFNQINILSLTDNVQKLSDKIRDDMSDKGHQNIEIILKDIQHVSIAIIAKIDYIVSFDFKDFPVIFETAKKILIFKTVLITQKNSDNLILNSIQENLF